MVKSLIYNIYGVVQGVGFRPFVHRIAVANRIVGKVINRLACKSIKLINKFKHKILLFE